MGFEDDDLFRARVSVPGLIDDVLAVPVLEASQPQVNDPVVLLSLDPVSMSSFIYIRLRKETDTETHLQREGTNFEITDEGYNVSRSAINNTVLQRAELAMVKAASAVPPAIAGPMVEGASQIISRMQNTLNAPASIDLPPLSEGTYDVFPELANPSFIPRGIDSKEDFDKTPPEEPSVDSPPRIRFGRIPPGDPPDTYVLEDKLPVDDQIYGPEAGTYWLSIRTWKAPSATDTNVFKEWNFDEEGDVENPDLIKEFIHGGGQKQGQPDGVLNEPDDRPNHVIYYRYKLSENPGTTQRKGALIFKAVTDDQFDIQNGTAKERLTWVFNVLQLANDPA